LLPALIVLILALTSLPRSANARNESISPTNRVELSPRDVVAFVGGEATVTLGESGHVESLFAAAYPELHVRLRNLGREGDTVFEQPRELNFPSLVDHLKSTKATVIFVQFGETESLAGAKGLPAFVAAYERMCDRLVQVTPRLVLITPTAGGAKRNEQVRAYADAVRQIASRRGFACADVSNAPGSDADVAVAIADSLGFSKTVELTGGVDAHGRWKSPAMEDLRRAVIEKNRLWFEYARPMNWAFLGGDRQFVPSSRDPDDLKVRVFPREMEKYVPLIERADAKIDELAKAVGASGE
jgi:hypothetical protein